MVRRRTLRFKHTGGTPARPAKRQREVLKKKEKNPSAGCHRASAARPNGGAGGGAHEGCATTNLGRNRCEIRVPEPRTAKGRRVRRGTLTPLLLVIGGVTLLYYPGETALPPLGSLRAEVARLWQGYMTALRQRELMQFIHISQIWGNILAGVGAFAAIYFTRQLGLTGPDWPGAAIRNWNGLCKKS
mgnify:CR=1 FL=1